MKKHLFVQMCNVSDTNIFFVKILKKKTTPIKYIQITFKVMPKEFVFTRYSRTLLPTLLE